MVKNLSLFLMMKKLIKLETEVSSNFYTYNSNIDTTT